MTEKVIEHHLVRIWLPEDGILRVVLQPGAAVDLHAAEEIADLVRGVTGRRIIPQLADIRQIKSATREARLFFSEFAVEFSRATGLFVASGVSRVIGNFALGIVRPKHPARLFNSEEAAIEWLTPFLSDRNADVSE